MVSLIEIGDRIVKSGWIWCLEHKAFWMVVRNYLYNLLAFVDFTNIISMLE